jgi:hypothetical protein
LLLLRVGYTFHLHLALDMLHEFAHVRELGVYGNTVLPFVLSPTLAERVDVDLTRVDEIHQVDVDFLCDQVRLFHSSIIFIVDCPMNYSDISR